MSGGGKAGNLGCRERAEPTPSDKAPNALWQQAVSGDSEAFAFFYRRHKDAVFDHCMTRLGHQRDAEDLTAEVFALAWLRRARVFFHEDADILPWLLVVSNHLLRRHQRNILRHRQLLRRLVPSDDLPDLAEYVADRNAVDHATRIALAALNSLKPADREIIEMVVINQVSPNVLAAATQVPAGTIRARLSRALSRARRQYDALVANEHASQSQEPK